MRPPDPPAGDDAGVGERRQVGPIDDEYLAGQDALIEDEDGADLGVPIDDDGPTAGVHAAAVDERIDPFDDPLGHARLAIDPRIRQRRVAIRRSQGRKRLLWLGGATALLMLVVLVVGLAHTPWFGAQAISVTGSHPRTPDSAIVDAAGLEHHPPLISVNPGAVARRVESLPFIASAKVKRNWPDGVQIAVTERAPVVQMAGPGTSWSLLDGHGRTLQQVPGRLPGLVVYIVHTPDSGIPPAPVGNSLPPSAGPGLRGRPDAAPGVPGPGGVRHRGRRRIHQPGPQLGGDRAVRVRRRPDGQVQGHRRHPGQRDPPCHVGHRCHRA